MIEPAPFFSFHFLKNDWYSTATVEFSGQPAAVIFPISAKNVFRDPFDPVSRIDREISERVRRLALGINLEDDLRTLTGALIVAEGKGKYLRVLRATTCSHELADVSTTMIGKLAGMSEPSFLDMKAVQSDIAIVQCSIIDELKRQAGKYVDRLLIVAVTDPGYTIVEDESQQFHLPICDPNLLAELSGISVIDDFRTRDLMAAGSGRDLDALPAWILFGDRSSKLANKNRILFSIGNLARAFYLPASDGLDGDLPEIQTVDCPGLNLFRVLEGVADFDVKRDIQRLNVSGNVDSAFLQSIDMDRPEELPPNCNTERLAMADCVRSLVVRITQEITDRIRNRIPGSASVPEIIVECAPEVLGTFANQFRRLWPTANVYDGYFQDSCSGDLNAILTATLGVVSVDQLPANIPWITGARSQKILGRITSGSPSNWRQLLREMADFQPPVMRLRDAI